METDSNQEEEGSVWTEGWSCSGGDSKVAKNMRDKNELLTWGEGSGNEVAVHV